MIWTCLDYETNCTKTEARHIVAHKSVGADLVNLTTFKQVTQSFNKNFMERRGGGRAGLDIIVFGGV